MVVFAESESVPQLVFLLHDAGRQVLPNPEEHEKRPLPSERVDQRREAEPIQQLGVSEEVECFGWSQRLYRTGKVHPSFHPPSVRSRQRVDEEHQEHSRVDTDVIIANSSATRS